jgi:hypothetical protein
VFAGAGALTGAVLRGAVLNGALLSGAVPAGAANAGPGAGPSAGAEKASGRAPRRAASVDEVAVGSSSCGVRTGVTVIGNESSSAPGAAEAAAGDAVPVIGAKAGFNESGTTAWTRSAARENFPAQAVDGLSPLAAHAGNANSRPIRLSFIVRARVRRWECSR